MINKITSNKGSKVTYIEINTENFVKFLIIENYNLLY